MENFVNIDTENPEEFDQLSASQLYFQFVDSMNSRTFTNDMLRYMLRELVSLSSLIVYPRQFKELMARFNISVNSVESSLNSI